MREKGSASGAMLGVIALCLVVLIGLGAYAYNQTVVIEVGDTASSTQVVYVATTTTSYVATTTTTEVLVPRTVKPVASSYTRPRQTATAYNASTYNTGNSYHSAFGLTVPGSYTVSSGRDVYGGVYDTASLRFSSGLQINVFSKEQWNDIRIQETINNKQGTGPIYFGEGSYLGENYTWIFSAIPGAYGTVPYGIKFY